MKWTKKGLIYKTDRLSEWQFSHTYCPTPLLLDDRIRIYTTFWDKNKIGLPGYIDVEIDNPNRIIGISQEPCLGLGPPGTFDEHGVTCSSVRRVTSKLYSMLYIGWQRQVTVPYSLSIGRAYSHNSEYFIGEHYPYLDRECWCPLFRSGASYIVGKETIYPIMVYIGATKWIYFNEYSRYWFNGNLHIHYAEEEDLSTRIKINGTDTEWCPSRPWIIRKDGKLHMWYTYKNGRPDRYLQGYAIAEDTLDEYPIIIEFNKKECPLKLGVPGEFDSTAASHATVLEVNPNRYLMFYMGNEFGKEGFGWAETESLE